LVRASFRACRVTRAVPCKIITANLVNTGRHTENDTLLPRHDGCAASFGLAAPSAIQVSTQKTSEGIKNKVSSSILLFHRIGQVNNFGQILDIVGIEQNPARSLPESGSYSDRAGSSSAVCNPPGNSCG
jgi:hypothetical protein